ncbi:Hpt domain-containing protein, partial [Vibrio parahaemolyticus]|nr:Hpt domain-containing protein [Vibrio parahaemolyticus]
TRFLKLITIYLFLINNKRCSTYMNSDSSLHTQWLTHFPADMQHHMAKVYLETMTEDLEALKAHLHEPKHLLQTVHKIKGGLAQIGLERIHQSALLTEQLGRSDSPLYQTALEKLITDLELSIEDVHHWVTQHT